MRTKLEEQFHEEFKLISDTWYSFDEYSWGFQTDIKLDDSYTPDQLRRIADLVEKYQKEKEKLLTNPTT